MTEQKKRGRPPKKEPSPGDRVPLSLRVTHSVRFGLEEGSRFFGRSLSQEAEIRLEQSFNKQFLLPEVLGLAFGAEIAALVALQGMAMAEASSAARHAGNENHFAQAIAACRRLLDEFEAEPPSKSTEKSVRNLVKALRSESEDTADRPLGQSLDELRRHLGDQVQGLRKRLK